MKTITIAALAFFCLAQSLLSQSPSLLGQLQGQRHEPIEFANVALYRSADSMLVKVEISDHSGKFSFTLIDPGSYYLVATLVGAVDLVRENIQLTEGQPTDLGILRFSPTSIDLAEATVTASRVMVEIKPDRTVFNVEGTINSAGSDAISLLRKAPGVTVDNNDNINLLGRAGILLYVDGKRMPLNGQDLTSYLQNLPAEQIDRIEIITNPGARYEAEGNAGIIDIRLKKDKGLGANGSFTSTYSQGRYGRVNAAGNGNYRNKILNAFGGAGWSEGTGYHSMDFLSRQNGLLLKEQDHSRHSWNNYDYRLGADFFLSSKHTIGLLVNGRHSNQDWSSVNRIDIATQANPEQTDSILIAHNQTDNERSQHTFNLNYLFDSGKGTTLNLDVDYGRYRNAEFRLQPNRYYDASGLQLLTEAIIGFEMPSDIDIYTFLADFESGLLGGRLGAGVKLSQVVSDNTFLVSDVQTGTPVQNDRLSNHFEYDERVYAGYLNYGRPLGEKWQFSAGLRAELTDAKGDLQAFLPELQEPPVVLHYLNWFPNAGISWTPSPNHAFALNYGRRINRPDYNVLNPFNNQLSQLSYEKGNPFLQPETVNNLELGYTLAYRYNIKIAYSRTSNQITRLIGPDEEDPRAAFITWANLAMQTVYSVNLSAPVEIVKGWNAYFNLSASHIDNQADYGDGAVVDVQAFTYTIYSQQTFDLPAGFKGEISGYFSGPGVWGGVFRYESNWSLDLGLQRKFLRNRLNARLSASDLFFQTGWDGVSEFDGLVSAGGGRWDSRRLSLSLSYNLGNENLKTRKRQTGSEAETGRLGGEGQ